MEIYEAMRKNMEDLAIVYECCNHVYDAVILVILKKYQLCLFYFVVSVV